MHCDDDLRDIKTCQRRQTKLNTVYFAEALHVVIILGLYTDQVEQMPAEHILSNNTYTAAAHLSQVVILRSTLVVPYPPRQN